MGMATFITWLQRIIYVIIIIISIPTSHVTPTICWCEQLVDAKHLHTLYNIVDCSWHVVGSEVGTHHDYHIT